MSKRIEWGHRPEIVGGGMVGKGDERTLGDRDYVKAVLAEQEEQFERRYWLKARGYDIDRIANTVAEVFEIEAAEIWKPSIQPLRVKAADIKTLIPEILNVLEKPFHIGLHAFIRNDHGMR